MVLKLYGSPVSSCSKRVAVVLHEKKIPFELHVIDFQKGEHKSPEYIKKQPFGQIPYIDDDGFILYESRAIGRYIQAKYPSEGTPLAPSPSDLKAFALFEQACSNEQANFDNIAYQACFENVFKKWRGETPDPAVFDSLIEKLDAKLNAFDSILSKQKYVAGNEITLADLFFLPYGTMLTEVAGSDVMSRKPNIDRWFKELSCRPSWAAVKDGVQTTNF